MPNDAQQVLEALERKLTRSGSRFEVRVDPSGAPAFKNAPVTLVDVYRQTAAAADFPFLTVGDRCFTYGFVLDRAEKISGALRSRYKVGSGTRVALNLPNGIDWVCAFLAVTGLGGCAVLIPPAGAADISALNVQLILHDGAHEAVAAHFNDHDISAHDRVAIGPLLENAGADIAPLSRCTSTTDAVIAFTSGSSGPPKAVVLTHGALGQGLMNMMFASAFASMSVRRSQNVQRPIKPRPVLASHLSHISGFGQLLLTMLGGGQIFVPEHGGANAILDMLHAVEGTTTVGAPAELIAALLEPKNRGRTASLKSVTFSGDTITQELLDALAEVLPDVEARISYGLTETCGAVCAISARELLRRRESCGRLVPTVECRISDRDGRELDLSRPGEIWLRGAMLARAYGTAPLIERGWFRTGDFGYLSADRYLHLLGREILTIGDTIVHAHQFERLLCGFPGIAQAVVLIDPGRVVGVYTIISGAEVNEAEIEQRVLSQFALPPDYLKLVCWSTLPLTTSGKISRSEVRSFLA